MRKQLTAIKVVRPFCNSQINGGDATRKGLNDQRIVELGTDIQGDRLTYSFIHDLTLRSFLKATDKNTLTLLA